MYAFAVFKKANYIFSIESVPAYIGGQIFLPFFEITIPKYPLPVGTSEAVSYTHLDVYKRQEFIPLRDAYFIPFCHVTVT